MKYIPKISEENRDTLLLDSTMMWDGCLDYANKHNMNVLYIDTTSVSSVAVILAFIKAGYQHILFEVPVFASDGTELESKIYCRFTR